VGMGDNICEIQRGGGSGKEEKKHSFANCSEEGKSLFYVDGRGKNVALMGRSGIIVAQRKQEKKEKAVLFSLKCIGKFRLIYRKEKSKPAKEIQDCIAIKGLTLKLGGRTHREGKIS